jgi:multiple antibiotic resistance protein
VNDTLRTVVFVLVAVDGFGAAMVTARVRGPARSVGVALATASGLLFLASLAGPSVLDGLDISTEAAEIAAGVVLLVPALTLLFRGDELFLVDDAERAATGWRAGIVPVAVPLLAGPAPLSVVAALAARHGRADVEIALSVTMAITLVALLFAMRHPRRERTRTEAIAGHFVGAAMVLVAFALVVDGVLGV